MFVSKCKCEYFLSVNVTVNILLVNVNVNILLVNVNVNILLVNGNGNCECTWNSLFFRGVSSIVLSWKRICHRQVLFCQNHHRRHHFHFQFIEEKIQQPKQQCLLTKDQPSQSINDHHQEHPHHHPHLSIIAHHGGHDANAAL